MRILLRKWQDKFYVWKDATYDDGYYYLVEDGKKVNDQMVYQTNILAINEDDRANYVKCAHCGATIKNDPESIEAHFAEREAQRNCMSCGEMVHYGDEKNINVQYTKNEDGTYRFTKTCDTKLGCSYAAWRNYRDINTEAAKDGCQYFQCRKRGVEKIDDTFVKYPGLFNKQITIDLLIKNGFLSKRYMGDRWNEWTIDLGLRGNTLHAVVNELGIVDRFFIHHRYERYTAYYSEKYDKLFFEYGRKYTDIVPDALSQAKYNSAKKIIAKLYKEAK